jgi:16S rRNA (cytosine967-C5)-methyltransferase
MAALDLQRAVAEQDSYANLIWPELLRARRLTDRDAAFATELAYGTLRWRGRHDAILAACVDRPIEDLDPVVLDALRLGVHQLHSMRVGSHAAVDETVNLVSARLHRGAAGLTNAVLRKVARGGDAQAWLDELVHSGGLAPFGEDPVAHLSVVTSHPAWIVRALRDSLSATWAQPSWDLVGEALLAHNDPAEVTLVARTGSREELLAELTSRGVAARSGDFSPLAVRIRAVNPAELPEVATGSAGVQDEGSQLVALTLAGANLAGSDSRWLDMCAGPGGKAALLGGMVAERGGTLTAVEQHAHRAALVSSALRPIRGRHEVLVADATTESIGSDYDRVLVDVPCTGLGALRRRPEARWRRMPGDLSQLTAIQAGLLRRALEVVRPSGLVLYATCSQHLAETESIVSRVTDWGASIVPIDPTGLPEGATSGPFLRLWPHVHDTDGMFAALIRRDV